MSPTTPLVDVTQNGSVKSHETAGNICENEDIDILKLLDKPRPINIERKRSFDEKSFSDQFPNGLSPHQFCRNTENSLRAIDSPCRRSSLNTYTPRSHSYYDSHPIVCDAWDALRRSLVYFRDQPVGTIAALDHSVEGLNYDQVAIQFLLVCFSLVFVKLISISLINLKYYILYTWQVFVRDFVPSALAFLMNGEDEVVKNFLLKTLLLQSWEKMVDQFKLGEGVMPASFKVLHDPVRNFETLIADFGESAIGRVAPVDSGFWWIILLRAYTKSTGDTSLAEMPECQRGMRLILSLCLSEGFDTFPTLLCADGCCMIDRRMVFASSLRFMNFITYS